MATQTTYYNLTKPAGTEAVDVAVINANYDKIDTEMNRNRTTAALDLADIYDSTASYAVGDYCVFLTQDGYKLYKCTSATTGVFNVNDWDEVCVTDELGSGGGGGGHTYIGNDGSTAMTQRSKAEFVGAYMQDDGSNNKTKVNVMRSMTRAEFDLLSAAEKKGLIEVTDETEGVNDKFQPVIYSESEREIGVWTNGKPLYQKTVTANNLVSGDNSVNHGISNLEIVVENIAFLLDNSGNSNQLPCISTVSGWSARARDFGSTSFIIELGSNIAQYYTSAKVTMFYTKSTDTAGSGQWTPQGVPTVHYSEDEQVIGTWVDGKTLYEKTIVLSNTLTVSGNNWASTGIATTADAIVYCYPLDVNNNYCGGIPCAVVNGEFAFNGSLGNAYIKSFIVQYTKSA